MTHITVKGDEPSVVYRYTPKEPATVIDGVPARDLTEFDLAAMSPSQRLHVQRLAGEDGGVYAKVGTVPRGLSLASDPLPESTPLPESDPVAESVAPEPAAKPGKKG